MKPFSDDKYLWESFKTKAEELFQIGYNLPVNYHIPAVEDIEGKLSTWKQILASEESVVSGETVSEQTGPAIARETVSDVPQVQQSGTQDAEDDDNFESLSSVVVEMGNDVFPILSTTDVDIATEESPELRTSNCSTTCPICSMQFADKETYESHVKTVHLKTCRKKDKKSSGKSAISQCPQCQKTFKNSKGLRSHMKRHENSTETASENATSSSPAKEPGPSNDGEEQVEDSDSSSDVEDESESISDAKYKCPYCDKSYRSSGGYYGHIKTHEEMKKFKCEFCGHSAVGEKSLQVHMDLKHTKDQPGEFACLKCDQTFMSEGRLFFHVTRESHFPLRCNFCPKEFLSVPGFRNHRKLHMGQGVKCQECDYIGPTQGSINIHVKKFHRRIRDHLCDICAKGFCSRNRLNVHRTSHFKDLLKDRYRCDQCPFTTHLRNSLIAHRKNLHTKTPGYQCDLCGAKVNSKSTLTSHQQRHLTKKIFSCPECLFKTNCKDNLQKHILRMHRDKRTYPCEICKKEFKTKAHVTRHQVIHTGKKEFGCPDCTYQCNVKENLHKHIVTVHKKPAPRVRPAIQKLDIETPEDIAKEKIPAGSGQDLIRAAASLANVTADDGAKTTYIQMMPVVATLTLPDNNPECAQNDNDVSIGNVIDVPTNYW